MRESLSAGCSCQAACRRHAVTSPVDSPGGSRWKISSPPQGRRQSSARPKPAVLVLAAESIVDPRPEAPVGRHCSSQCAETAPCRRIGRSAFIERQSRRGHRHTWRCAGTSRSPAYRTPVLSESPRLLSHCPDCHAVGFFDSVETAPIQFGRAWLGSKESTCDTPPS